MLSAHHYNQKTSSTYTPCIFVCYRILHNGFRSYDHAVHKIILSRHVFFDESVTPNDPPSYTFLDENLDPPSPLHDLLTTPTPSTPSHETTIDTWPPSPSDAIPPTTTPPRRKSTSANLGCPVISLHHILSYWCISALSTSLITSHSFVIVFSTTVSFSYQNH